MKIKDLWKIGIFAVVILCAFFIIQWYQLTCMAHLMEDVYVIGDARLSKDLLKGTEEKASYPLFSVDAHEPVYRRASRIYVGEGKAAAEASYPFFANDGNALMIMGGEPKLIDTEFEEVDTFTGMYVSDGLAFNYDKTQADESSYVFLKLNNGLFMNTQTILFSWPGGTKNTRMNSVLYLGEDVVRFASFKDAAMDYEELSSVRNLTIEIGGMSLSYEQLRERLGLLRLENEVSKEDEKTQISGNDVPEMEAENNLSEEDEENGLTEEEREQLLKEKEQEEREAVERERTERQIGDRRLQTTTTPGGIGAIANKDTGNTAESAGSSGTGSKGEHSSGNSENDKDKQPEDTDNSQFGDSNGEQSEDTGSNQPEDNTGEEPGGNQPGDNTGTSSGNTGSEQPGDNTGEQPGDNNSGNNGGSLGDNNGQPGDSGEEIPDEEPGEDEGGDIGEHPGEGNTGEGGTGTGGNRPAVMPSGKLRALTADVYSVDTYLSLEDPSGIIKRVVLELYWQPADEDGTPKEYSSNPNDYRLMYRKTYRGAGEVHIDNLPPDTYIYARGIIYYYAEGNRTGEQVFYEGFEEIVKTLDMSYIDDLYVDYLENDPLEVLLPSQMKIFDLAISGPNSNVLDKIRNINIKATAIEGANKGNIYRMSIGLNEARNHFFYREEAERKDWISDTRQLYLPSDTLFDYEIELCDMFENRFTRVVRGYQNNTVDTEKNSSLNCCEKAEQYTICTGQTRTAKQKPTLVISQAGFNDEQKDIDRVAFHIQLMDPDLASVGFEEHYVLRLYADSDKEREHPLTFQNIAGESVTELPLTEQTMNQEADRYEIHGLTAGQMYVMEVLGDYNLHDNQPDYRQELVGSQRFSTISLGNYGRVAYTLQSEHILPDGESYESATAQRVGMKFNYAQTNYDLVDLYLSSISLNMLNTTTRMPVFTGTIHRDKLEQVQVSGEGTQENRSIELSIAELLEPGFSSGLKDGYMPKILLEYADFSSAQGDLPEYRRTAWELLTDPSSPAELVLLWEEGTLNSKTSYQMNVETQGYQGGSYHDITSRSNLYRRLSFTTLKKMPYVTYDDILVVSDYVELLGVRLHDEDRAIVNGTVLTSLTGQQSVVSELDYGTLSDGYQDGYIEAISFRKLRIGNGYELGLAPETIRRDTAGRYTYKNELLLQYSFMAGDGINGTLIFDSIAHPLVNLSGSKSDYIKYDASDYERGYYINTAGVLAASGGWTTTGFIDVKPGEVYYFNHIYNNNFGHIAFYDAQGNPLRIGYKEWGTVATNVSGRIQFRLIDNSYIEVPKGAYKLRFTCAGSVKGLQNYATAECISLTALQTAGVDALKEIVLTGEGNTSREFAVTEGCTYAVTKGSGSYQIEFLNKNGDVIESSVPTAQGDRVGQSFTAPSGAVKAKITKVSVLTGIENIGVHQVNISSTSMLEAEDISQFSNSIRMVVSDAQNNLIAEQNRRIYLDVYVDGVKQSGADYPVDTKDFYLDVERNGDNLLVTKDRSLMMSFDCMSNRTYELRLYVKYYDREILLDTLKYDTNRTTEVIHNDKELAKLMRNRYGDFIVVEDLYLSGDYSPYASEELPFCGTIDFQGHSITLTTSRNYNALILSIGASAILENFVLNTTYDATVNRIPFDGGRGLTYTNHGTIRDFIVNYNLGQGMYRNRYMEGVCYNNYGTVENFAIYYAANSTNYVGIGSASVCYNNLGNIRNGMVYSQGPVNVTTGIFGGSDKLENPYTSLVAAINSGGGVIENVYVLGSMAVEDDMRSKSYGFTSNALLTGSQGGVVRNCFTVGDLMQTSWKDDGTKSAVIYPQYGPALPGNVSNSSTKSVNNYYFSQSNAYTHNVDGRHEAASSYMLLQDVSFYNSTVNKQGMFQMEDVAEGYYPRVLMDASVYEQQRRIALTAGGIDNTIQYQSCRLTEQHEKGDVLEDGTVVEEDYALATMTFTNRLGRNISNIQVEGLKVTGPDGGNTYPQKLDGALYRVEVRLTPNGTRYSDRYLVQSFIYDNTYTTQVTSKYVSVLFYRELTQANWLTAIKESGYSSYYKLGEDIDFRRFEPYQREDAAKVFQTGSIGFSGMLDGRGHALRNFELPENQTTLFDYLLGGRLKDMWVENLSITSSNGTPAYMGLVGRAINMSELTDVVLKDASYTGIYQNGGGLVAAMTDGYLENCVVSNLSISSRQEGTLLRMGGLIGYSQNNQVNNCLVRGLSVDVTSGKTAEGCGGLIGTQNTRDVMYNTYAQGNISTKFSRCGGIVGSAEGTITSVWANVGIVSSASQVGGITGQVGNDGNLSQALAVGEVFTTSADNYGRINGGFSGRERELTRCYAFDEQKVNSELTSDFYDATGLLTSEQLKMEQYYWNTVNLGYAFAYDNIGDGYLPKLYRSDLENLLPCQEEGLTFSMEGVSFTAEGSATYQESGTQVLEKQGSYDLHVALRFTIDGLTKDSNLEQYFGKDYRNIVIENIKITGVPTVSWDGETCILTYGTQNLHPEKYVDSYRVVFTYGGNQAGMKLDFVDTTWQEVRPLYYHIYRAMRTESCIDSDTGLDLGSWSDAMQKAGTEYENFMIMNDLDFKEIQDVQTGLQLNRLEGYFDVSVYGKDGFSLETASSTETDRKDYLMADLSDTSASHWPTWCTLRNVNREILASDNNTPWIYELRGTMQYIRFQDVNWVNKQQRGGTEYGLIRVNTGLIQYVDFERIVLDYGRTTQYIGCIAQNQGSMEYLRVRDIKVDTSDRVAKQAVRDIGGLCGRAYQPLCYVGARGSIDSEGNYNYKVVGAQTIRNADGTYSDVGERTGGVLGYTETGIKYIFADTLYVTGSNRTGGIAGYSNNLTSHYYETPDKDIEIFTEIKNSKVEGNTATGGVYGLGYYGGYTRVLNCTVTGTGDYAGGVFGQGHARYSTVTDCQISAVHCAGGILGSTGGLGIYGEVTGCTIYAEEKAGGAAGQITSLNITETYISDTAVFAGKYVGGIVGMDLSRNALTNAYNMGVTRTLIGGSSGSYPVVEKNPDGSYHTKWAAQKPEIGSKVAATTTDYVGGLIGYSSGSSSHHYYVDDSVTVKGEDYIGGVYGQCDGGNHRDFAAAATVEARRYAGGFAGEICGFAASMEEGYTLRTPKTTIVRAYLSGSVKASTAYAGGLAGNYKKGIRPLDPETGQELPDEITGYTNHMERDNYKQILLALTAIDGNESRYTALLAYGDESFLKGASKLSEAVSYLRIYNGLKISGSSGTMQSLDSYCPGILSWEWRKTGMDYTQVLTATSEDMKIVDFYKGALASGGMYLGNSSSMYHFDVNSTTLTSGFFPYVRKSGSITVNLQDQDGIPIPIGIAEGITTYSVVDYSEYLDAIRIYTSGAESINLDFPAELAEAGQMLYEEQMIQESPVPETEFFFTIRDAQGNLLDEQAITERTYTLHYDFSSQATITVSVYGQTQTFTISPLEYRRTVMAWGNHVYYLKADGVYREDEDGGSEQALAGHYLHLYKGEALRKDGMLVSVETGMEQSLKASEVLCVSEERKALYQTEYAGTNIDTFGSYSLTDTGNISEYRIFAKNEKMFGIDPELEDTWGLHCDNFIVDYYMTSKNHAQYLSVLTDGQVLEDLMTPLQWPENEKGEEILRNYQIQEVADTIYSNQSVAILRYYDNRVAAFNYLTGTLIFIDDSEQRSLEFGEYADLWLKGIKASLKTGNAFENSEDLVSGLIKKPIKNDLLPEYSKGTDVTEDGNDEQKGTILESPEQEASTGLAKPTDGKGAVTDASGHPGSTENGSLATTEGSHPSDKSEKLITDENVLISDKEGSSSGEKDTNQVIQEGLVSAGKGTFDKETSSADKNKQTETDMGEDILLAEESDLKITEENSELLKDIGQLSTDEGSVLTDEDSQNSPEVGSRLTKENGQDSLEASDNSPKENRLTTNASGQLLGSSKDSHLMDATLMDGTEELVSEGRFSKDGVYLEASELESEDEDIVAEGNILRTETSEDRKDTAKDSESGNTVGMITEANENQTIEEKEAKGQEADSGILENSDKAYVTMVTLDSAGYEVYRADELLTVDSHRLMSENEKLRILEANGIIHPFVNLEEMKLAAKEKQTGILLIVATTGGVLVLLFILYRKKKKIMNQ